MSTTRISQLITAVEDSLSETHTNLTPEILSIEGMSGKMYKKFANRLLSKPIVKNYLEIGVWKGSTAIAALYNNHHRLRYTVIDNFSEFGGPKNEFISNWKQYNGTIPNLIDDDCFCFNPRDRNISDIDVYFYDGNHEEISHYKALHHYYEAMADSFILMVDDWTAWNQVKDGTNRAIGDLNLKIEMKIEKVDGGSEQWWNGCGIFVLSKTK